MNEFRTEEQLCSSLLSSLMAHSGRLSGAIILKPKAARKQDQGALLKSGQKSHSATERAPLMHLRKHWIIRKHICQCLLPTLAILGVNTSCAFVNTVSTTSAAGMEAYFFLRSKLPVEEKETAPCTGSNTLFLIFLSRSTVSSSSSFWITSLACSRLACSQRLTFIKV